MMEKKKCELCGGVARMFCDSDQASLCWDCDGKVHGANFLVARHTRCLLCSACQSPTHWKASGVGLGATVLICESCLARKVQNRSRGINGVREDEEEEAENQVVPWDGEEVQQPPMVSSSSSVGNRQEAFSGDGRAVVKRKRRD